MLGGGGEGGDWGVGRSFCQNWESNPQSLDTDAVARLQAIPFGSSYKKSSKNRANCRLFLDSFSSVIMNDLTMPFTFRFKMDAKCTNQQWIWIRVANYFGTPPADWVHGFLCFEPGVWIWTDGFRRLFALLLWRKISGIFFIEIQPGYVPLNAVCLDFFFFGIFL